MGLKFNDSAEAEFQELLSHYPNTHAALLPALHLAQKEFGWVSVEVMDYLAERLDVPPAKVLATATFYTMYNKAPVGKCHLQVCTTLSCAFRGGYELIERLEQKLGIKLGETTPDGNFTLSESECLASCGTAPMLQLTDANGVIDYFEDLASEESVDDMIARLTKRCDDLPDPSQMH